MGLATWIKRRLRHSGYDLIRFPVFQLIERERFDLVLDVGANRGQFAHELREYGYTGRIVSFEPLAGPYAELAAAAAKDPRWTAAHTALGRSPGSAEINVAAGSAASSSFLDLTPPHPTAPVHTEYVDTETVTIRTLDQAFPEHVQPGERALVKIDTQGYERDVLAGGAAILPRVHGLMMEMSLVPLYQGEALIEQLIATARDAGFTPACLTHGYKDPATHRLLQVDGLFLRMDA